MYLCQAMGLDDVFSKHEILILTCSAFIHEGLCSVILCEIG